MCSRAVDTLKGSTTCKPCCKAHLRSAALWQACSLCDFGKRFLVYVIFIHLHDQPVSCRLRDGDRSRSASDVSTVQKCMQAEQWDAGCQVNAAMSSSTCQSAFLPVRTALSKGRSSGEETLVSELCGTLLVLVEGSEELIRGPGCDIRCGNGRRRAVCALSCKGRLPAAAWTALATFVSATGNAGCRLLRSINGCRRCGSSRTRAPPSPG